MVLHSRFQGNQEYKINYEKIIILVILLNNKIFNKTGCFLLKAKLNLKLFYFQLIAFAILLNIK